MPQFSIISPVYKTEPYLRDFLNSVVCQSYHDFEVILVDDGSPDNSGAICDEYSNLYSNVRTIHKLNGGVGSARNAGIEVAKGEWVLFYDSDDIVKPHALQKIYEAIENDPTTDVVIYSIEEISQDGKSVSYLLPISAPDHFCRKEIEQIIYPYFCKSASFLNSPVSKAFKLSVIKNHGIRFQKRVRGEDWLFCLDYFRVIRSACTVPDVLYSYMRNDSSAMSKYCPAQFQLWCENWEYKISLVTDYDLKVSLNSMKREMLAKVYYHILETLTYESGSIREESVCNMLFSSQMDTWLKSWPLTLRDVFYHIRLIYWRLRYIR